MHLWIIIMIFLILLAILKPRRRKKHRPLFGPSKLRLIDTTNLVSILRRGKGAPP